MRSSSLLTSLFAWTAVDRYIARLIAVPLIGTLVLSAMLLVLEKMLRLFDFVANEGGPVSVVWRMLANLLPEYLSLGIPIGLTLGIVLAFRKLATSSELDVMQAVGLGYHKLLRAPYAYAIVLAALNLAIVGFVQPYARYAYEELRFELRSGALGASIKVGEFTNLGDELTLRIEQSIDDGRQLNGIFAHARVDDRGQTISASARRGEFLATGDPDTIVLRLTDGMLIHRGPTIATPRMLSFTTHDLPIDLPAIDAFRGRTGDREMTIPELFKVGGDVSQPLATRLEARSNMHFRLVEVATMLLLPLLAVALAVPPKRSTSALGVFLAIVILVTQHKINEYGDSLGTLGRVDPILALWVPAAVFAALVLWMFRTLAFVPGGQPIGALERVFAKFGKRIAGMFKRLIAGPNIA